MKAFRIGIAQLSGKIKVPNYTKKMLSIKKGLCWYYVNTKAEFKSREMLNQKVFKLKEES